MNLRRAHSTWCINTLVSAFFRATFGWKVIRTFRIWSVLIKLSQLTEKDIKDAPEPSSLLAYDV
jgi:hypothetical protein